MVRPEVRCPGANVLYSAYRVRSSSLLLPSAGHAESLTAVSRAASLSGCFSFSSVMPWYRISTRSKMGWPLSCECFCAFTLRINFDISCFKAVAFTTRTNWSQISLLQFCNQSNMIIVNVQYTQWIKNGATIFCSQCCQMLVDSYIFIIYLHFTANSAVNMAERLAVGWSEIFHDNPGFCIQSTFVSTPEQSSS